MIQKFGIAAALLVGILAVPVAAATCSYSSGKQLVTYTVTQGSPDAITQAECFSGNNNNTIDASFDVFGVDGWVLASTSNDTSGDYMTSGLVFGVPVPVPNQTTWSILNPFGYSEIMITFKQGNSFSAFLLDSAEALAGLWGTAGPGKSTNDLSHASIYYRGDPMAPVPLPAAGLLLAGGLGAMGMLRRRRRAV